MKLSELILKFENMEKIEQESGKNVLTKDQAFIYRDVLKQYQSNERYAVLDAKSGSGKTTLIRALQKYAESNPTMIHVCASTGKAASALGGVTIHKYLGLSMVANESAESKDNALSLTSDIGENIEKPDILIIDEASMIGKKVFSTIERAGFNFVLFVLDSSQLPPVKEKKVEWQSITNIQYKLTKTLRAKDERLMKLFDDFRDYKNGVIKNLALTDYINGDNIVSIDFNDLDYIPANSECCAVGYRNRLVEYLVSGLTHDNHNMYNLNSGVSQTKMVAVSDEPMDNGYYVREFVNEQIFYNGEDVKIEKLHKETDEIVSKGYCLHNGRKLSINKNKTGITISAPINSKIKYGAKEPIEHKNWLSFPKDDIVSKSTLSCINDEYYVLLWDGTEDEYNELLDKYFMKVLPFNRISTAIKNYYKKYEIDDKAMPKQYIENIKKMGKREFNVWFKNSELGVSKTKAWADFLKASSVVSARFTTARTIHKSQGISVPAVIITDSSFYGASLDAQYVATTRMKHGLILVNNFPEDWKEKEIMDEFE